MSLGTGTKGINLKDFHKPKFYCAVPENIYTTPAEGIGISWEVGGSVRPKNLKKCMKLNWDF